MVKINYDLIIGKILELEASRYKDKLIKDIITKQFKISFSSYYNLKKAALTGYDYKTIIKIKPYYLKKEVIKIIESKELKVRIKEKKVSELYKTKEIIEKKYSEIKFKKYKEERIYKAKKPRTEKVIQIKKETEVIKIKDKIEASFDVYISGYYYMYKMDKLQSSPISFIHNPPPEILFITLKNYGNIIKEKEDFYMNLFKSFIDQYNLYDYEMILTLSNNKTNEVLFKNDYGKLINEDN